MILLAGSELIDFASGLRKTSDEEKISFHFQKFSEDLIR